MFLRSNLRSNQGPRTAPPDIAIETILQPAIRPSPVPSGNFSHSYWSHGPVEIVDLPVNSMVDLSIIFCVSFTRPGQPNTIGRSTEFHGDFRRNLEAMQQESHALHHEMCLERPGKPLVISAQFGWKWDIIWYKSPKHWILTDIGYKWAMNKMPWLIG